MTNYERNYNSLCFFFVDDVIRVDLLISLVDLLSDSFSHFLLIALLTLNFKVSNNFFFVFLFHVIVSQKLHKSSLSFEVLANSNSFVLRDLWNLHQETDELDTVLVFEKSFSFHRASAFVVELCSRHTKRPICFLVDAFMDKFKVVNHFFWSAEFYVIEFVKEG